MNQSRRLEKVAARLVQNFQDFDSLRGKPARASGSHLEFSSHTHFKSRKAPIGRNSCVRETDLRPKLGLLK